MNDPHDPHDPHDPMTLLAHVTLVTPMTQWGLGHAPYLWPCMRPTCGHARALATYENLPAIIFNPVEEFAENMKKESEADKVLLRY